jgi:hypothetical protein
VDRNRLETSAGLFRSKVDGQRGIRTHLRDVILFEFGKEQQPLTSSTEVIRLY